MPRQRGHQAEWALGGGFSAGGRVVYQPRAVSWHEHARDPGALRRTLFDYGVGFPRS